MNTYVNRLTHCLSLEPRAQHYSNEMFSVFFFLFGHILLGVRDEIAWFVFVHVILGEREEIAFRCECARDTRCA